MTPDEEPGTRSDEAEVRRLLAALGNEPVPMPPEVAARLDATLADLAAKQDQVTERDQVTDGDQVTEGRRVDRTVTPLPSRDRPRRWPQLLVAAAAVSVLGLGVGELLEGPSGSDSMNAAAERAEAPADAAGGATEDSGEAAPYATQDSPGPEAAEPPADREGLDRRSALRHAPAALSRLHSQSLTADVQRLADVTGTDTMVPGAPLTAMRDGAGCDLPEAGPGDELYAVRLDGDPATLLLHRAEDGRRLAQVFACEDPSAPVAGTTVDAG